MKHPKVAVLKTDPDRVLSDYSRLMDLAELPVFLDPGCATILKDNLSWHYFFPGANTTPWQLEGTIQGLRARGYNELMAVHNDTVVTNAYRGGKLNRLAPVYQKYRIPELYNFVPEQVTWVPYQPKSPTRVLHRIFPKGIFIPECFIGKNIVHLPTVKCHIYTTTTGAMKNAFGGLLNTKRHYTHSVIHETLVDLLMIQQEIHAGIFALMDGTTCGNGPGPRTMIPVQKDLLLASGDCVAIDAVAAHIMGFDPMSIDYIRIAHEDGLGTGDIGDIQVVGEDISGMNFGFEVGDNMASRVGDLFWFSPLRALQRLLFRTPLVYLFIFGSFLYHDYVWYPIQGRKWVQAFQQTPWGRRFQEYEGSAL